MKKISFDFDGTLTFPWVQTIAKRCIKTGYDVWILTSRYDDTHADVLTIPSLMSSVHPANDLVYDLAAKLGIPERRIIFTNKQPKYLWLAHSGIHFHMDDDEDELDGIKEFTETEGIYVHQVKQQIPALEMRLFGYSDDLRDIEKILTERMKIVTPRIPEMFTGKEGAIMFLINVTVVFKETAENRKLTRTEYEEIEAKIRAEAVDMKDGPYRISSTEGLTYMGK